CVVVAHPPNAQIFLRSRRGLFCVDSLVLPDTFSRNAHYTQESAFLPSWWLQLGIGDIDFRYAITMYHLLTRLMFSPIKTSYLAIFVSFSKRSICSISAIMPAVNTGPHARYSLQRLGHTFHDPLN